MRKITFIIILLIISISHSSAQQKFIAILDSLSFNNKLINIKIPSTNGLFIDKLEKKQNFVYNNKSLFYLNSYNNFSVYGFLSLCELKKMRKGDRVHGYNTILIFDHNLKISFSVVFGLDGDSYAKKDKKTIDVNGNFSYRVSQIVKLDNEMKPVYGVGLQNFVKEKNIEIGDLFSEWYFYENNNRWHNRESKFTYPFPNIKDISYEYLIGLFSRPESEFNKFPEKECTSTDFVNISWLVNH